MKPLLTILIPTYQSPEILQYCVQSLVMYTEYPYKIVIINNDPDGREDIDNAVNSADFDYIEALHMEENGGWMTAINAGMERVDTPYVCMLNDDVVFIPGQQGFWRQLCGWFELPDTKIAEVGPCTNYAMGHQSLFTLRAEPAMYVPFLIGFCAVLRSDVFREVGLLDESLPGGDDLDLGIRLHDAGYDLICDRKAYIHHIGQQTGQKVHSGYWNSEWQSDKTNNALMAKHGVSKWYDQLCGVVRVKPDDYEEGLKSEDAWREKYLPFEGNGLNLGSGARTEGTWGLDISKPGDKGAGGRAYEEAVNDLTADVTDVPAQDGSLDYLLANHILEHLVDPLAALREWRRIIKPGGKLLLTAPNHAPDYDTMVLDYTHLHALTPGFTAGMMELVGWNVIEAVTFPLKTFGILAEAD